MDKKYFGPSGLTTTSASYLANLAQEQIKTNESWLNYITFTNETKTLVSSGKELLIREANCKSLNTIKEVIESNAQFYTFIAYVKEAIKAKEKAVSSLPDFEEWANKKLPACPKHPELVTEAHIVAEFTASEMQHYLHLQQYAAVYGKCIHANGSIADARANAQRYANNPTSIENLSNDVCVSKHTIAFSLDEIDEMYNQLQATRREYDKQLNNIKFGIRSEVNKRNNALDLEFQTAVENYRNEMNKLRSEYNTWIRKQAEEIETTWKIVIPQELQPIFKYLQSLGKVDK